MHDANGETDINTDTDTSSSIELRNLKVISALGRGAKGVVFLVQTEHGELLALKAVLKSSLEKKKNSIERQVLSSFDHPLLPKLHGVLVTDTIVGYAIDYCSGGDLNSLRKKQIEKMFSVEIIRFYAAELVLALEYLHKLGVVYRDLKPENVMIQHHGHLMLVDFDLCTKLVPKSRELCSISSSQSKTRSITPKKKKNSKFTCFFNRRESWISPEEENPVIPIRIGSSSGEKSNSFVGTEEYVAPEIILGDGHDFAVDWWCLGIMLYEMLYGATPFRGLNRKDTFHRAITKAPDLTGEWTPLRDLIGKLLEKDPNKRIGVRGIKGHEFFEGVDWEGITEMPRPPFIPEVDAVSGSNKDIDVESYVQGVFKVGVEKKEGKDEWPTQIQKHNFLVF